MWWRLLMLPLLRLVMGRLGIGCLMWLLVLIRMVIRILRVRGLVMAMVSWLSIGRLRLLNRRIGVHGIRLLLLVMVLKVPLIVLMLRLLKLLRRFVLLIRLAIFLGMFFGSIGIGLLRILVLLILFLLLLWFGIVMRSLRLFGEWFT